MYKRGLKFYYVYDFYLFLTVYCTYVECITLIPWVAFQVKINSGFIVVTVQNDGDDLELVSH